MNKLISNNLLRLQHEITFLEGDGITPEGLAAILGIKKSIIYDDIIALNNESNFPLGMSLPLPKLKEMKRLRKQNKTSDDEVEMVKDSEYFDDISEVLLTDPKFASTLKSGAYDDCRFFHDTLSETAVVMLTPDEADTLNSFLDKEEGAGALWVKNSNRLRFEDQVDLVNYLLEVIKDGGSVDFSYKAKTKILKKTIRPIKIIHNTTEDTYYVFDHKGTSYNMDNILPYSVKDSKVKQNIARNIDEKRFEKMWGVNYSEKGVKVKLKIFNEGKVIERVKNDLGSKLNDTNFKFFEENGTEYAIFKDEVIGTEVFLSWVYSYGASMVLLEPRELVDKIIDSIEQRKQQYSK